MNHKDLASAVKDAYREVLLEMTEKHIDPKYALPLTQKNVKKSTGQEIPLQEIDRLLH